MKLELRHNKIGDTAWDIVNNYEHINADIDYNIGTFNSIFKALVRETVLVSFDMSVKNANAIAERECNRIKVRTNYYKNRSKKEYIAYVLKFIDNYINSDAFRKMIITFIQDVYYEQDIVVEYALEDLIFDEKYNGNIVNEENNIKSYIVAILCSMFLYLYNNKLTAYKNKPIRKINISKIMNDMYIFKKKGYYWQTTGERVDGINSKLIIPDVKNATPKAIYDIEDEEYGTLLGAEPESMENTLTIIKACAIRGISDNAYYDLIEEGIHNDNISVRIDYELGILAVISDLIFGMTEGIISSGDVPVFKSLVISVEEDEE